MAHKTGEQNSSSESQGADMIIIRILITEFDHIDLGAGIGFLRFANSVEMIVTLFIYVD